MTPAVLKHITKRVSPSGPLRELGLIGLQQKIYVKLGEIMEKLRGLWVLRLRGTGVVFDEPEKMAELWVNAKKAGIQLH